MWVHRPSLLVGFGEYGLRLQALYLSHAASRGALEWEDDRKHAAGRRLRRLAAVCVENEPASGPGGRARSVDGTGASAQDVLRGTGGFEILEDLLPQIDFIPANIAAEDLADHVRRAADWLGAVERREPGSVGLDVYCLAAVRSADQLGRVARLLEPVMRVLAGKRELTSPGEGQDVLNFIVILDLESYWADEPPARGLRTAFVSLVKAQRAGRRGGAPAFGRIYLFDSGRAASGYQPAEVRLQEAHLFLDFLLTANQRNALRELYQPSRRDRSPLCAVGIRSIELDAHHLSRLAAARFAVEWLPELLDEGPPVERTAVDAAIERVLEVGSVAHALPSVRNIPDDAARKAEEEILSLDRTVPTWPQSVIDQAAAAYASNGAVLEHKLNELVFEPLQRHLDAFPQELRSAIDEALLSGRNRQTLGGVLVSLNRTLNALPVLEQETAEGDDRSRLLEGLQAISRRFLVFVEQQLQPARTRPWWAMLSLVIAILAMPVAAEGLSELLISLGGSRLRSAAVPVGWLARHSSAIGAVLFILTWAVLRRWGQRALERRVDRARAFFTDAQRGRLVDRVRRAIEHTVRRPLERQIEMARRRSRQLMAREVSLSLHRVKRRLERRRDEVRWLTAQLQAFLRSHGVEHSRDRFWFASEFRSRSLPRIRLETDDDLEQFSVPLNVKDAPAHQAEWGVFGSWREERPSVAGPGTSPVLLDPLRFLEWLLEKVRELGPMPDALTADRVAEELERAPSVDLGFYWLGSESLPAPQHASVVPGEWKAALRDPMERLDFAVIESDDADPPRGRVFLVKYRTEVSEELMLGKRLG